MNPPERRENPIHESTGHPRSRPAVPKYLLNAAISYMVPSSGNQTWVHTTETMHLCNGRTVSEKRRARARIDAGLVEEDDFDGEREGWTAEQVWETMQHLLPMPSDPVVTHGDFSLDNILMLDGEVVGCIDAGRVGVADRYQDLAILWSCLGEFDASLQDRLLTQYGIVDADERKLQFHLMLDEMF